MSEGGSECVCVRVYACVHAYVQMCIVCVCVRLCVCVSVLNCKNLSSLCMLDPSQLRVEVVLVMWGWWVWGVW